MIYIMLFFSVNYFKIEYDFEEILFEEKCEFKKIWWKEKIDLIWKLHKKINKVRIKNEENCQLISFIKHKQKLIKVLSIKTITYVKFVITHIL